MMTEAKQPRRRRRPRRSQEEIQGLIESAALQLFAERGYAGATTQEIARLADVGETLLFKYYGDKASLYDAVVSAPFREMMDNFVEGRRNASEKGAVASSPDDQSRQLFDFFDTHRELFTALILGAVHTGEEVPGELRGLDRTFRQAAGEVAASFRHDGRDPPFDADIAVRLAFGMIAASVVLRPFLFSTSKASSDQIRDCVTAMVARSVWPDAGAP